LAKIELYLDETKGYKSTFMIQVMIWGNPENCLKFKKEIQDIVNNNSKILAPNFKEFHGNQVNGKNYSTIGKVYSEVLKKFKEFLLNSELSLLIGVEGENSYINNAGFIKLAAKQGLGDPENEFRKLFPGWNDTSLAAFYHTIDQLIVFLRYRDKFGVEGDEIDFFPDSSGTILQYSNTTVTLANNYITTFFDSLKIWGNSLTNVVAQLVQDQSWPMGNIKLSNFEPTDSSVEYIIQTCDIISNYFLNYIRFVCGINSQKCSLKANEINDLLNLNKPPSFIKNSFIIDKDKDKDKVICENKDLKGHISCDIKCTE